VVFESEEQPTDVCSKFIVYEQPSAATQISSRELRVHIADHAYNCGSTIFGMKLIITSAGIQVVALTLVLPAKFINAQSAAGTADWYLVDQY
jgi:hypothetical protein